MNYIIADASGLVVADTLHAEDAALIVARWGNGAHVLIRLGRRNVEIYREGQFGDGYASQEGRARTIREREAIERGAAEVRRSWRGSRR